MRIFLILALSTAGIFLAHVAQAQHVRLDMKVEPSQVHVGENFVLEVEAEVRDGDLEGVDLPDLAAFEILQRSESSPMQVQFGFGTGRDSMFTMRKTQVYTFVLRARKEGRFAIEPAKIRVSGRVYTSEPATVVVTRGSMSGQSPFALDEPTTGTTALPPAKIDQYTADSRMFIRTRVDKDTPVVGEQITLTYLLYVAQPLRSAPIPLRQPSTAGFWTYDLLANSKDIDTFDDEVEGQRFNVYVLKKVAAFPLEPGTFPLGSMLVRADLGSAFFGRRSRAERTSEPVKIQVRALPAGKPAGLVHVGKLQISSTLEPARTSTGSATTYTLKLQGTGRFEALRPELSTQPGLRILSPNIRTETSVNHDQVEALKIVEWLIIPEQPGRFELAPIEISFFDPEAGTYQRATTQPMVLEAVGAATAPPTSVGPAKSPIEPKTSTPKPVQSRPTHSNTLFQTLHRLALPMAAGLLALLLTVATWLLVRSMRVRSPSSKRSPKNVKILIKQAEVAAHDGDVAAMYSQLAQALREALQDVLPINVRGATYAELREKLQQTPVAHAGIDDLMATLEHVDQARFVPQKEGEFYAKSEIDRVKHQILEIEKLRKHVKN